MSTGASQADSAQGGSPSALLRRIVGPLLVSQVICVLLASVVMVFGGGYFIANTFHVAGPASGNSEIPKPGSPEPFVPTSAEPVIPNPPEPPAPTSAEPVVLAPESHKHPLPVSDEVDAFRSAQFAVVTESRRITHRCRLGAIQRRATDADKALTDDFARLETDEAGRRIAANSIAFRRYLAVREEAESMRRRFRSLQAVSGVFDPSDMASNSDCVDRWGNAARDLVRIRAALALVVAEAEQTPAGQTDLETITTGWPSGREEERNVLVTEQIVKSRSLLEERCSDAETERKKVSDELDQLKGQLVAEEQAAADDIATEQRLMKEDAQRIANERAVARQKMEAVLPEIRSRLTPFITPGYTQPNHQAAMRRTVDKAPMSYAGLLQVGALEDSLGGLRTLLDIGRTGWGCQNDRPLGQFLKKGQYSRIEDSSVVQELKSGQRLLRDHGEAMAEAGLLSP